MMNGIFNPVSNHEDWTVQVEVTDDEDDTGIDVDALVSEITVKVREIASGSEVLSGSLTGGEISIIDTSVIEWTFPASSMGGLSSGSRTYEVSVLVTMTDDSVSQLILATLPVLDGF